MEMSVEDLMQLKVDLSLIDGGELEALAVLFGRYEERCLEEEKALRETFQKIREILRSETIARKAGIAGSGLQRFYLFPKYVFTPVERVVLGKLAAKIANDQSTGSVFGDSLLLALMV